MREWLLKLKCLKFFKILYWSIVDLQCCVSFRCTAKWIMYAYTYIYSFSDLFPYKLLQNIEYSSLCYTVGPCWLSLLHMKVKVAQSCLNLSMEFSRHEYWSGLPFPSPHLPNPGIKPRSLALQADSIPTEPLGKPHLTYNSMYMLIPTS